MIANAGRGGAMQGMPYEGRAGQCMPGRGGAWRAKAKHIKAKQSKANRAAQSRAGQDKASNAKQRNATTNRPHMSQFWFKMCEVWQSRIHLRSYNSSSHSHSLDARSDAVPHLHARCPRSQQHSGTSCELCPHAPRGVARQSPRADAAPLSTILLKR